MRDVQDIIYSVGLDNKWSYTQAKELIDKFSDLAKLPNIEPEPDDIIQSVNLTEEISRRIIKNKVSTPEKLRAFINENKKLFGYFRRKTHEIVKSYYSGLVFCKIQMT